MLARTLKGLSLTILLALSLNQTSVVHAQEIPASEIFKHAGPSVVLIQTYDDAGNVAGAGSGFVIAADGRILTNFHVIAHTKRATVRLANDDAYDKVYVLGVDRRKDIALLKIDAVNLVPLRLGNSSTSQIGDKVYTLGTPLGFLQNTFSEGLLSGVRQMDGYKLFQLSAPISHGSSGGPVLNASGEVIGLVDATISEGQNLNFAIPIDYAAGMRNARELQYLADYYEPEEKPRAETKAPPPASETAAKPASAPTAFPSGALKQDAIIYLANKMGIWTLEDSEIELGKPLDRRDGIANGAVYADIYKFASPQTGFSWIELSVNRNDHRVRAAYFYYSQAVSWKSIEAKAGKNYQRKKAANGRPFYIYQLQGHTYAVLLDSANNVYNVGVW
jgi:hypothetical protein